jgi:hypothetical protein
MVPGSWLTDPEQVHNGPSSQTTTGTTARTACCGASPCGVALTGPDAATSVEHVRCVSCGASGWMVDGITVARETALAVLADAFGRGATSAGAVRRRTAHRAPVRRLAAASHPAAPRPASGPLSPAAPAPADLAELLAGWQVLGASS